MIILIQYTISFCGSNYNKFIIDDTQKSVNYMIIVCFF